MEKVEKRKVALEEDLCGICRSIGKIGVAWSLCMKAKRPTKNGHMSSSEVVLIRDIPYLFARSNLHGEWVGFISEFDYCEIPSQKLLELRAALQYRIEKRNKLSIRSTQNGMYEFFGQFFLVSRFWGFTAALVKSGIC